MQNAFIAKGHGYESGEYGRCTAFDGFKIIAQPLPGNDAQGRESRVFPDESGQGGVTYASFTVRLAKREFGNTLYILMQHGGGREVLQVPEFYDGGALESAILAMPERVQFALLKTIYQVASNAAFQAQSETRAKWAQAFTDGKIKKSRATKSRCARVEIVQ